MKATKTGAAAKGRPQAWRHIRRAAKVTAYLQSKTKCGERRSRLQPGKANQRSCEKLTKKKA